MTSRSRCIAARRWGWWGSRGAERQRSGGTILRLIPATAGEVRFHGEDFFQYRGRELRQLRRQMQIIFQDPVSSLNPRMTDRPDHWRAAGDAWHRPRPGTRGDGG